MPAVKAFPFPNPTGQTRFEGKIAYKGTLYEYKIFLTPLHKSTPDYDYVVNEISGRRYKGRRNACLGTTKKNHTTTPQSANNQCIWFRKPRRQQRHRVGFHPIIPMGHHNERLPSMDK